MDINFIRPTCGSEGISLITEIGIFFSSPTDSLIVDSIIVTIDGKTALIGDSFQCGFKGTLYEDSDPGMFLSILPVTSYSAEKTIIIAVYAVDGEGPDLEACSFKTICSDCLFESTLNATTFGVTVTKNDTTELLWNSTSTEVRIIDDAVNKIHLQRTNNNTYVAVGTDAGVSLIKNCISSLCYGGGDVELDGYEACLSTIGHIIDGYGTELDGYCISYLAPYVYVDELTKLYILNSTQNRIEVFYNVENDLVGRVNPDYTYDVSNVSELAGLTINNLLVIEYLSTNLGSNTLFLATDNGVIRIDADESTPETSESNMVVTTYNIDSSGATYEILGGDESRVTQIGHNRANKLLAVATENIVTFDGGVTVLSLEANALMSFEDDMVDVTELSFSDTNIFVT